MKPLDFFNTYSKFAIDTQNKYGVPASITLAQAALESSWGESGLTKNYNNFFGIKKQSNDNWTGPSVNLQTGEVFNSNPTTISANFRVYNTPQDSFNDHAQFFVDNERYSNLFDISLSDPYYYNKWAAAIQADGYATAPDYGNTLVSLIALHNLTQYDDIAKSKKKLS